MKKNLYSALFLLSFFSVLIGTEASCQGNLCSNNPSPCCYVWPMSIMEKKMLSPFCHNGQICYILDEMAYSFTKCYGYCHGSETLPGHSATGVWTKCRENECRCCRPKVIEKMKVCAVCCNHRICLGMGPGIGSLIPPGGNPRPTGGARMPSKAEVERLAKQQQAGSGGLSRLAPIRPGGWLFSRTRRPTRTPGLPTTPITEPPPFRRTTTRAPSFNIPGGSAQCGCPGCCPPWATTKIFDVPRDCGCQTCV